ncbi:restriction endonuclease subunit S [Peijinzhouia sedimentorum]
MKTLLGNHIKLFGGGTPSKEVDAYWSGNIPWASVKDLREGNLVFPTDRISEDGVKYSATRVVPKGSLIIATRMAVGKVAFASVDMAINQDLKVIEVQEELDRKFLFYFLKANNAYFQEVSSGATVKGIKIEHINRLELNLPPLSTQKKIAAILDAADAHRQKTKQLLTKYDQLAQSIFLEMFGDPVTNPKGWEVGIIADVVSEVKYGTSSKAEDNGNLEYLRMNNITYNGDMNYSNLKYISLEDNELDKYTTQKFDLLFNRTNSKELVGKTGIILDDKIRAIAGYLIRVRLNSKANPFYVWSHLNSKWSKLTLENMCKNIVGMANINAKELQKIKILIPPKPVQDSYQQKIQSILNQKGKVNKSLNWSEDLFNHLLQKAFKGNLVK